MGVVFRMQDLVPGEVGGIDDVRVIHQVIEPVIQMPGCLVVSMKNPGGRRGHGKGALKIMVRPVGHMVVKPQGTPGIIGQIGKDVAGLYPGGFPLDFTGFHPVDRSVYA